MGSSQILSCWRVCQNVIVMTPIQGDCLVIARYPTLKRWATILSSLRDLLFDTPSYYVSPTPWAFGRPRGSPLHCACRCVSGGYTTRPYTLNSVLLTIDLPSVTSSVYCNSSPTDTPLAMTVSFTPVYGASLRKI